MSVEYYGVEAIKYSGCNIFRVVGLIVTLHKTKDLLTALPAYMVQSYNQFYAYMIVLSI